MKVSEAIKQLQEMDQDEPIILTYWSAEDVLSVAEQNEKVVTLEQARKVIEGLDSHTDLSGDSMWVEIGEAIDDYPNVGEDDEEESDESDS